MEGLSVLQKHALPHTDHRNRRNNGAATPELPKRSLRQEGGVRLPPPLNAASRAAASCRWCSSSGCRPAPLHTERGVFETNWLGHRTVRNRHDPLGRRGATYRCLGRVTRHPLPRRIPPSSPTCWCCDVARANLPSRSAQPSPCTPTPTMAANALDMITFVNSSCLPTPYPLRAPSRSLIMRMGAHCRCGEPRYLSAPYGPAARPTSHALAIRGAHKHCCHILHLDNCHATVARAAEASTKHKRGFNDYGVQRWSARTNSSMFSSTHAFCSLKPHL